MKEIDWEIIKAVGPTIAASVFIYNIIKDRKAKKREEVSQFLGDKKPVAYAALKIIREGFKGTSEEISEQIQMVIQGRLFEGSVRARILLYSIVSANKDKEAYSKQIFEIYEHNANNGLKRVENPTYW